MGKSRSRVKKGGNDNLSTSIQRSGNGILDFFSNAWNDTTKGSIELFDNLTGKKKDDNSNQANYPLNNNNNNYKDTEDDYNPNISSSTSITRGQIAGRKRSKKSKGKARTRTRSKRGGTNIATYAGPVYESNVAQPTYWINGGKRKRSRSKSRRTKKRSN